MAWTNLPTQANGVVINAQNWNDVVNDIAWLGGADGNTHASTWSVAALTVNDGSNGLITAAGSNGDLYLRPKDSGHFVRMDTGTVSVSGPLQVFGNLSLGGSAAIGFFGTTPVAKQTVSGAKSGNTALASVIAVLAGYGMLTDATT